MNYFIKDPIPELAHLINYFWMIESEGEMTPTIQKIIPDGFPELIYHYGDPFEINTNGNWELQSKQLVAGQIRNFFYLRNTNNVGMFAIKLQPWALRNLFGFEMAALIDQVKEIDLVKYPRLNGLEDLAVSNQSFDNKIRDVEAWFVRLISSQKLLGNREAEFIARGIIDQNGREPVHNIVHKANLSERSLERYFKKYIGLSPKFYSRVVRLSYTFKLVEEDHADWSEVAFLAGFYDQSHFIKDFKTFTGEEPTKYPFLEKNMANFFLKP